MSSLTRYLDPPEGASPTSPWLEAATWENGCVRDMQRDFRLTFSVGDLEGLILRASRDEVLSSKRRGSTGKSRRSFA